MSRPSILTVFYSLLTSGFWLLLCQIAGAQESSVSSSARGYCYVEPYQLRFECLVRMKEALSIIGENESISLLGSAQTILKDKTRSLAAAELVEAARIIGVPAVLVHVRHVLPKGELEESVHDQVRGGGEHG